MSLRSVAVCVITEICDQGCEGSGGEATAFGGGSDAVSIAIEVASLIRESTLFEPSGSGPRLRERFSAMFDERRYPVPR